MEDGEKRALIGFTKLLMARFDREVGHPVSIDPEDLEPRNNEWSTCFYVVDPSFQVFEVNIWKCEELDTQREVLAEGGYGPLSGPAMDSAVLARYDGKIIDTTKHGGLTYTGIRFGSMIDLTEWAHIFQMQDRVNIVGTPRLDSPVSVNVAVHDG